MLIIKGKGIATLTGIPGNYNIPDAAAREQGRRVKAEAFQDLGSSLMFSYGAHNAASIVEQLTTRDTQWQRANLTEHYRQLNHALLSGDKGKRVNTVLKEARELKPDIAVQRHREVVPKLLSDVQATLHKVVAAHADGRLADAKRAVRAAVAIETPKDAGAAAAAAIAAMEIRQRLAAMTPGERVQAVAKAGRDGNLVALNAVAHDPMGGMVVPAAVLAEAEHAAIAAQGGQFLLDDLTDAEAEQEHLRALATTTFHAVLAELRDAGVNKSLLDPWIVDKAAVEAEKEEVEG